MRSDDTLLPPEAIERLKREASDARENLRNHRVGVGLALIGALIALLPLASTGDITLLPAILSGAFLLAGGMLIDPERFSTIAEKGIAKIPGKD